MIRPCVTCKAVKCLSKYTPGITKSVVGINHQFYDGFNGKQVSIEAVQLVQLKEEIQKMQKELEEKQKKAGMIERRIDEKSSLLKVSEFIQNQSDKTELVALVEQLSVDEGMWE